MAKRTRARKNCFFGLHFDLHPGEKDTSLGADITEGMIERLLRKAGPDFIQYDCKGHRGYTGYPTKIGRPSPGISKDSLRIWRRVTRKHGVGLYVHYSGVWDSVALAQHPEWARVDGNGKRDKDSTSTFGPYVDELMIPQLIEVCREYKLDGVWVDGDCWAAKMDFSKAAEDAFRKAAGVRSIPRKPGDKHWKDFVAFNREQFRNYLRRWVDALHQAVPGIQATSNWAFSTFMPEPVSAGLDYLSGDYSPINSVNTARLDARYFASTGMPWDLMAWGFNRGKETNWSHKPAVQLMQEAAVVLAQGGGFQIYYQPTRSGWIDDRLTDIMAEVSEFCRKRKSASFKTESVPQVALLLSGESARDKSRALFRRGEEQMPLQGALHALLELGYSVDVLAEHHLAGRLDEYPLVVLAECHRLPADFRKALVGYMEKGGKVLLVGVEAARLFRKHLGVDFKGSASKRSAFVCAGGMMGRLDGKWQDVKPAGAKVFAHRWAAHDTRKGKQPAVTINKVGRGELACMFGPLGSAYCRAHVPVLRSLLGEIAERLFPDPLVKVDGPPCIDVTLRRKAKKLIVHLANTAGMQTDPAYSLVDFVPSAGPLSIAVRLTEKPGSVKEVGEKGGITHSWSEGILTVRLERLHLHSAVVIE